MLWTDFVTRPLEIATALANGELGGSTLEAHLIIGATISGMAAFVWPGKGKDRRRFVEVWARYSDSSLHANRISLPLLADELWTYRLSEECNAVETLRPELLRLGAQVVTGDDIDVSEADVLRACPTLDARRIRCNSYGALYYRQVRSSVVHEYQFGARAVTWPMTTRKAGVSYANYAIPGAGSMTTRSERHIHYGLPWLSEIVRSIARRQS